MPARFCPQCGVATVQGARFCIACGASLDGSVAPTQPGAWRLTSAGLGVLGFFLVAGLGIWATILSPAPPTPGPGRGAEREARPATTARAELPPDHPNVPMEIPAEVKTFIDDLAQKAAAAPRDVGVWSRLAQVYYRSSQVDPAYFEKAEQAFQHVLELDPKNAEALKGLGSIHFERDEPGQAIAFYEKYLAEKPDDTTVRTALGAAYNAAGETAKALVILRDVTAKTPDAWPAQYYFGLALAQQGDEAAGLAAVQRARALAPDDSVRAQIDDTISRMGGTPPAGGGAAIPATAGSAPASSGTPFQQAVEAAFRAHQIMGPRITGFQWTGPGTGRVLVQNFPMAAMPDEVKKKFTGRLADALRDAAKANPPDGAVRIDIADASSGAVMATVEPSAGG